LSSSGKIEWIHGNSFFNDNSKLDFQCQNIISSITGNNISETVNFSVTEEKVGLSKINAKTTVISDEDLSFRFSDFSWSFPKDAYQNAKKLKDYFLNFFDKIEIIITIRAQSELLNSYFNQCYSLISNENIEFNEIGFWLKSNLNHNIKMTPKFLNYNKIFDEYAKHFGSNNVHVLLYEDLLFSHDNFFSNLGKILNINPTEVKNILENNHQNKTIKTSNGTLHIRGNTFFKNFIHPLSLELKKVLNNNTFNFLAKLFKFIFPNNLLKQKIFIRRLNSHEEQSILSSYKKCNSELIKKLCLDYQKMKNYNYL